MQLVCYLLPVRCDNLWRPWYVLFYHDYLTYDLSASTNVLAQILVLSPDQSNA